MKKLFITGVFLFLSVSTFAQGRLSKVSVGLSKPVPTGDNFINKNTGGGYNGLIDIGIGYNFLQKENWGVGILLNGVFLNLSEINEDVMVLSPKLRFEYIYTRNKISFAPEIAFGFSNWRFRTRDAEFTLDEPRTLEKYNHLGITVRGGARLIYDTHDSYSLFLQFYYEFTRLEEKFGGELDSDFRRNIEMMYPGVGITWYFKRW